MNRIIKWVKPKKLLVFSGLVIGVLILGVIFTDSARAETLFAQIIIPQEVDSANSNNNPEQVLTKPATQNYVELAPDVKRTFQKLEKAVQNTNQVISDLPEQFDLAATQTQGAIRQQIEDDIEERQDLLENLADEVDDLAEKVQKYHNKLPQSQAEIVQDFQSSLENLALTIDNLADDVESARDNITVPVGNQIRPQIEAVKQALYQVQQSIQGINQNPA